jgi:hypothetical protein
MAYAHVQSTAIFRSGTTNPTLAYGSNLTAGNLAVCTIDTFQKTVTAAAWSVGSGSAPTLAASDVSHNDGQLYIYYAPNVTAGAHTVQFTMANGDAWLAVHEYSGIDTSTPLGPNTSAGGTSTTPDSGNTTTLAGQPAMAFGLLFHDTVTGNTVTAGSSPLTFNKRQSNVNNSTQQAGSTEEARTTSTSGVAANATLSASHVWEALVVAFYETGAVSGKAPPPRSRPLRIWSRRVA